MASFLNNLVVTLKEERVKQKAINNSNEARISNLNDEVEHLKIQLKDMSSNKVVLSDKRLLIKILTIYFQDCKYSKLNKNNK